MDDVARNLCQALGGGGNPMVDPRHTPLPSPAGTSAAARPAAPASQRKMGEQLRSALHVCQITACTLPRDEYANGRKNNGAGPGAGGGRRR